MALFPLGLKGNLSPLGLNPSTRRVRQGPLWVHTLNAATHRIALQRLAVPSTGLTALPHVVMLHHSIASPGLSSLTHDATLHQSEPFFDLTPATHRLVLDFLETPSPELAGLTHAVTLHPSDPLLALTTATHSMRLFRSDPGNNDPC